MPAGDIIRIGVDNVEIEATGNHPIWVAGGEALETRPTAMDVPESERSGLGLGRWVEARDLRCGDVLVLLGGEMAAVSSVSARQEKTLVYNLSVEGSHTYSVSQAGVLVHNTRRACIAVALIAVAFDVEGESVTTLFFTEGRPRGQGNLGISPSTFEQRRMAYWAG